MAKTMQLRRRRIKDKVISDLSMPYTMLMGYKSNRLKRT